MPARGCAGPAMGLLHMGHTQRTSSHFTRHLQGVGGGNVRLKNPRGEEIPAPRCCCTHFRWKACWHGSTPSSSFALKSSRQTAQVCCGR